MKGRMPSRSSLSKPLKEVEDDALVARVGFAPRVRIATPSLATAQPEVKEKEMEDLTELEANEKLMARILEYKSSTQLVSMRAIMAKAVLKSIKHPNLARSIKMMKTASSIYVVYDYFGGPSLE